MANLTIRNIDEALEKRLRMSAAENGRSMEEEVRHILKRFLLHQKPDPAKPDPIVDFRLMIVDLRYRFALSFLSVCTERQLSRAWRVTCLSSHRLKRQEHVSAAELNLLGKNPAQT